MDRKKVRVGQLKEGMMVQCFGFTFIPDGEMAVVREGETGFFIRCDDGCYFIDGQIEDGVYLGLFFPVNYALECAKISADIDYYLRELISNQGGQTWREYCEVQYNVKSQERNDLIEEWERAENGE